MRLAVRLALLGALCATTLAPAAYAQATTALPALASLDPAYIRDLHDIIDSLPLYEGATRVSGDSYPNAYDRAVTNAFVGHLEKEEFIRRMTPAWASVISPDLASRLTAILRLPVAKKITAATKIDPNRGIEFNELTPDERIELERIGDDPAEKEFRALFQQGLDASRSALADWRIEFTTSLTSKAQNAIAQNEQSIAAATKDGRPGSAKIHTIGFAPWDQVIVAIANCSTSIGVSLLHFTDQLEDTDYWQLSNLENLATRRNYADVLAVEKKLERELDTAIAGMRQATGKLDTDLKNADLMKKPQFRQNFAPDIAELDAFAAKLGEKYRRLFAAQRQLITFARERDGKIKLVGEQLTYRDKRDEAAASKLLDRIGMLAAEVDAIFENNGNTAP